MNHAAQHSGHHKVVGSPEAAVYHIASWGGGVLYTLPPAPIMVFRWTLWRVVKSGKALTSVTPEGKEAGGRGGI